MLVVSRRPSEFRSRWSRAVVLAAAVLTVGPVVWADDWTRFRGENGQGRATGTVPTEWTDATIAWKVELPGTGHSAPVIVGDRLFTMSADLGTATRQLLCLGVADGKTLWRQDRKSATYKYHRYSGYATATPAADAERVYFALGDPESLVLAAYTHAGSPAWEIELGPYPSQHGFGGSPIVVGDKVIQNVSGWGESDKLPPGTEPGEAFVICVDAATGRTVWKTPRQSGTESYTIPCVRTADDGVAELVCASTQEGLYALDLATGKPRWAVDCFTMRTVSSPVLAGDLVLGSTGSGGGGNYLVAVRPRGTSAQEVWRVRRQAPYVPTSIYHDGLVYLFDDTGIASCVEAATGKVVWQERLGRGFFGSPVLIGDRIVIVDQVGQASVLATGREFRVLGTHALDEESYSTPAVGGGLLVVRSFTHLTAVKLQ